MPKIPKNAPYFNVWDRMDVYEPHEPDVTPEQLSTYRKTLYGTVLGMQVWGVDGLSIRGTKDIDFTSGGNPARYRYVPNGELWVESAFSAPDALGVAVHEGVETVLMIKGLPYGNAHDLANVFEWNLRQAVLQGGVKSPATHADAMLMAEDWLREKVDMVQQGLKFRLMTFPHSEIPGLRKRLNTIGHAYTTRVDTEQGKWKTGEIVESPLGKLHIVGVKTIDNLFEHPFLNELTPAQQKLLSKHDKLDVVKFMSAK